MTHSLIVPRAEAPKSHTEPTMPWGVVFWGALGLTAVGFLDAAFLWVPFNITEITWRVNVIRSTVDALPLGTIGLAALLFATVHRQSRNALNGVVVFGGAVFVTLMILTAWFLASAVHLIATGGQGAPDKITIARTAIFAVIYLFVYAAITGAGAKRITAGPDGSRPV